MVFNRLTKALTNAGNTVFYGHDQASKIRQLESMGFHPDRARHALNACENDVERAAELLLVGDGSADMPIDVDEFPTARDHGSHAVGSSVDEGQHVAAHNDEQMRLAIEASLAINQVEETRNVRQAEVASMKNTRPKKAAPKSAPVNINRPSPSTKSTIPPAPRSAAAINAGKAAALRNQNQTTQKTLDDTHPNVKIPQKLSDKSKEEQIMRCANRLKPHVMAIDTLLRVLTSVKNNPDNPKYRTIDRSNPNYITHVRDKPGAEDFLSAMNYRRIRNELRLERHLLDSTLLYLGISALEQMRLSSEYIEGKLTRAFHAEMRRVAKGSGLVSNEMSQQETEVRLGYLQECPKEPEEGRGALMNVYLGEETERIEGGHVDRRFDSDDTLMDVLNWLGGCYGTELIEKLYSREWCLCDLNRYPMVPLDVERHSGKTLQYLGLFPSGKLGVRLSGDEWRNGGSIDVHGSARGLGAASRSMLH